MFILQSATKRIYSHRFASAGGDVPAMSDEGPQVRASTEAQRDVTAAARARGETARRAAHNKEVCQVASLSKRWRQDNTMPFSSYVRKP